MVGFLLTSILFSPEHVVIINLALSLYLIISFHSIFTLFVYNREAVYNVKKYKPNLKLFFPCLVGRNN